MQQAANKNQNIKRNKKISDVTQTTPPQTELDLTRRDIEWLHIYTIWSIVTDYCSHVYPAHSEWSVLNKHH